VNWSEAVGVDDGFALIAENSWGNKMFWAPEVVYFEGTFLMFYTVQEHLAVAESPSPLGPFTQQEKKPLHADIQEIDPHVFIDDDGTAYFYFVRFTNGNEIWAAEMNPDLRSIKEDTLCRCFGQSQAWEKSTHFPAKVTEGPFVLKHKGLYYLTYSANHFRSIDYGVGYALSQHPLGPWKKYEGNPVLQSNEQVHGAGHHCVVRSPDDLEWFMVYHTHYNLEQVQPRKLALDRMAFETPFGGGTDFITVKGPTLEPQSMPSGS
jgi:beta-xylosidase